MTEQRQTSDPSRRGKLPAFLTCPRGGRQWFMLILRAAVLTALMILFFRHPDWYSKVNGKGIVHYMRKRILLLLVLAAAGTVIPCFRLKLREKAGAVLAAAAAAGILLLSLISAESVWEYRLFEIRPLVIVFNLMLALAVFLVFYVITNRVYVSSLLTYAAITGFAVLNYYICQFRGDPINAADLYVVGTAMNVAGDYSFEWNWPIFRAVFTGAVTFAVLGVLPAEEFRLRGKTRLAFDAAALCLAVLIFRLFAVSDYPLKKGVEVKVFMPKATYRTNGEILNFVRGFYYLIVEKPDGYSSQAAGEAMDASGYVSDPADLDDGEANPNVIIIMNESLTDYTDYPTLELSGDPLEFIHSLRDGDAENVIVGNLHTDVFGGRTANSEYEVLTGNSIAFLPYNAVPYALYVMEETPSISWNLRAAGYQQNIVFHPYKGNGYSRPRAYPNLGFEQYFSKTDINKSLTDADYVRKFVSDEANYRQVIGFYEAAKKESSDPFYLFNITMQNHGGYSEDFDNFEQDISISGELSKRKDIRRFINLMDYSDEAFEKLTQYFSQTDDPTVIVMFGDHEPGLSENFYNALYGKEISELDERETFQQYITPVIIWANYDINPGLRYDETFADISINYLSAEVMKLAGVPMTAYQKFLTDMQEEIPVFTAHGYLDREGNYYQTGDTSSPHSELVHTYHMFEYNYQFDKKHRREEFFSLQQ